MKFPRRRRALVPENNATLISGALIIGASWTYSTCVHAQAHTNYRRAVAVQVGRQQDCRTENSGSYSPRKLLVFCAVPFFSPECPFSGRRMTECKQSQIMPALITPSLPPPPLCVYMPLHLAQGKGNNNLVLGVLSPPLTYVPLFQHDGPSFQPILFYLAHRIAAVMPQVPYLFFLYYRWSRSLHVHI